MAYLLSKPDGWECRNYDLVNQGPAGKHIIQRVLKELQEAGYIHRYQKSNGHKIEWVTEIYENPELNTTSRNTDIPPAEEPTGGNSAGRESGHIVSTDNSKNLSLENTDLNGCAKKFLSSVEKAELKKLVPYFADQCDSRLARDELKDYIRLGYQMTKEICPLNITGASPKSLQDLARAAKVVMPHPDHSEILKSYKHWWYNVYWAGKKGQSPTPAQVGDTWGQFEAQRINAPAIKADDDGGFYV
jgi:hypothetical protein